MAFCRLVTIGADRSVLFLITIANACGVQQSKTAFRSYVAEKEAKMDSWCNPKPLRQKIDAALVEVTLSKCPTRGGFEITLEANRGLFVLECQVGLELPGTVFRCMSI